MAAPPLSVKIPIYNCERFLAECIRSIQAQTFGDFEVIAVLDGCTDRSEEILMDLKDERFRVVKHETNRGVVAALNTAVELARAPLLARMDADDIMLPERLRKQYEFMTEHGDVTLLGTWFDKMDERGELIGPAFPFPGEHEALRRDFRIRNSIGGPTMMLRTGVLRTLEGYSTAFPIGEDMVISLRFLAEGFRLANLAEVLLHYRVYKTSYSQRQKDHMHHLTNLAYAKYGPLIWGDDAPEYELGAPLHRRIAKKLRRLARGQW